MTRRQPGLGTMAAVLFVLLTATGWPVTAPGGAPTAAAVDPARGTPGPCPDDTGVTVVVDFQQVGSGEVIVRCSPSADGTGLDVLRNAGFQMEGVRRWGDSFVCRIENTPSPGEALPVRGDEGYTESCIDTPPATAYWSYWHATNGGSWQYSQWGLKNRTPVAGGFEGWSFSLNATADANPAPRFTPVRQARPADPTPPGAGDPVPTGGGATSGGGGSTSGDDPGQDGPGSAGGDAGSTAGGSGAAGGSDTSTGNGTDGGTGQPGATTADGSGPGTDGPAPLPRQPRDGADATAPADATRTSGPESADGTAGPGDAAAATGDVAWSGGEQLASGAETDGGGWLGLPSGVWWTLLAALALTIVGTTAARRRSGRTT